MRIELKYITLNPENHIGEAASICYDSKTDEASNIKRAAHCVSSGHLATLRFAYADVLVDGISRVCSHQLVRVAHAGILQRSQRYVKESNITYVDPPALDGLSQQIKDRWTHIQDNAEALYLQLVNSGQMKKEDARYILPQGCTTSLRICGNFQMWLDLLRNRTDKAAQWEVKEAMTEVKHQLAKHAPGVFGSW